MAQWQEMLKEEKTHLWELYESGLDSQISLGIRQNIPTYVDFYEGRQWPEPTQSTKNLPRPVVNIVKMICRSKKAAILNAPVKVMFKSYSPLTDTNKFNSFYEFISKIRWIIIFRQTNLHTLSHIRYLLPFRYTAELSLIELHEYST